MELHKNEAFLSFGSLCCLSDLASGLISTSPDTKRLTVSFGIKPARSHVGSAYATVHFFLCPGEKRLLGKLLYHVSKCGFKLQSRDLSIIALGSRLTW